jgi:PAS domain S-box-containing protein
VSRPDVATEELALLDSLFANAPVGLAFWDRDLRYRRINDALAASNGVPADEHLGRTTEDVLGPDWSFVTDSLHQVLETGEPITGIEQSGTTPAEPGRLRTWRVAYYPVTDAGVACVVVEVTAERTADATAQRAVRAEQAASALLDAVFAAAPVGLSVFDVEGRYQKVNAALAELAGTRGDALIGRRPGEVLGALGAQIDDAVQEVLRTGVPTVEREFAAAHPGFGGTLRHRSATYYPVLGPDGVVAGVGGVVRDVGRDRQEEEARAELLREALTTRAQAEAQEVRAEVARDQAETALQRVTFLAGATERLARTLDYEETLREVAQIAVPELADWCIVTMLEPGRRLVPVVVAHHDPRLAQAGTDLLQRFPSDLDAKGGVGAVVRTGVTEHVPEVTEELLATSTRDAEHLRSLAAFGLRSAITVPLRPYGRTIGALTFISADSGRRFGTDDVTLAEALAARAALAVDNARLYTERSKIAHVLQRSLLPASLPRVPGLDVAVRYRAAGEQNEVGGDFYDLFSVGGDGWMAVVGDVAGKGAEAAALTSLSRHTLRAAALRGDGPVEQLTLLNDALLAPEGDAAGFVTVALAHLQPDAAGAAVTLITGGHPPPIIVRTGGTVERLELRGSLVGALPDPRFAVHDLRLDPGDRMLLYTDGVIELRGQDPQEGERTLLELVTANAHAGPDELALLVERHAVERQQGEPRDDIAVLALRANPRD